MKKFSKTLLFIFCIQTSAQEHCKHFRISPVLSHTYIPMATQEGNKTVIVPSFGLDLEFWLNEKLGIGFHNDLELENFEIEKEEMLFIERSYPLVITLDMLWKFHKEWILVLGSGMEFEKKENLFIIRTGLEYEIKISKHWDVTPTAFYDFRSNNFSTWSIGIGFGRCF